MPFFSAASRNAAPAPTSGAPASGEYAAIADAMPNLAPPGFTSIGSASSFVESFGSVGGWMPKNRLCEYSLFCALALGVDRILGVD